MKLFVENFKMIRFQSQIQMKIFKNKTIEKNTRGKQGTNQKTAKSEKRLNRDCNM